MGFIENPLYLHEDHLQRVQTEAIIVMLSVRRKALIALPVLLSPPVHSLVSKHERRNVIPCFQNDRAGAQLAEVDGIMQSLIA